MPRSPLADRLRFFATQASEKLETRWTQLSSVAKAIQLKVDDLVRSNNAGPPLSVQERATDGDVAAFTAEFQRLRTLGTTSAEAAERARSLVHPEGPHTPIEEKAPPMTVLEQIRRILEAQAVDSEDNLSFQEPGARGDEVGLRRRRSWRGAGCGRSITCRPGARVRFRRGPA